MNGRTQAQENDNSFNARLHQTPEGKKNITKKKKKRSAFQHQAEASVWVQLCLLQLLKQLEDHRGLALGPTVNSTGFMSKLDVCSTSYAKELAM